MKLRIKGNSLRLRLTQSEVAQFAEKGEVVESIGFGNAAQLDYALRQSDSEEIRAQFGSNRIEVIIPKKIAENWTTTDQVGFENEVPINEEDSLSILVEKDFNCLKPRPNEDETDMFPNPNNEVLQC